MRQASSFVLYYNKIYLMNDTVLRDLHPSSDSFSLIIEYGVDRDYTFLLDDGSTRHARVNSLETFGGIRDLAAVFVSADVNRSPLSELPKTISSCCVKIKYQSCKPLQVATTSRVIVFV